MASYVLFLSLLAVSAYGHEVKTHPQYLPSQQTPYQNGYSIYYTQVPSRSYNFQNSPSSYPTNYPTSYPTNYVVQGQRYYTPYSYQYQYQPKEMVQKVPEVSVTPQTYSVVYQQTYPEGYPKSVYQYPVRQETSRSSKDLNENKQEISSAYEQMYSPSYPYGSNQQMVYPRYTQEQRTMVNPSQQQMYPYFAYQTKDGSKVVFPLKAKQEEQEYQYQRKEATPKVFFPFQGIDNRMNQEGYQTKESYPYQTKEVPQKETYPVPVQQYLGAPTTRPYPEIYAPVYPEGYYPIGYQGYQGLPEKQELSSKNLLPNKPVIHVKYDALKGFPHQYVKEEVLQNGQRDYLVNDEEFVKNANKIERNQIY